jgi:hypothetical protein
MVLNAELGIVEGVYAGHISKQDGANSNAKMLAVAPKGNPLRVLLELRDVIAEYSITDLYWIAKTGESNSGDRMRRMAILVSDQVAITAKLDFFETTSFNRGSQVKVFTQRQDAIDWLLR